MKTLLAFAFASLMFAACADTTVPTEPSTSPMGKRTQAQDDVTGGWIWNPCCGSYIELSGRIHRNYEVTVNDDGSYSVKYHANWAGVGGTDQNGMKYRVVGSFSEKSSWESTGAGTFRIVDRERFQATGPDGEGCTFVIRVTLEVAVDEYGNVTVIREDMTIECV